MAETVCHYCGEPVGYERRFYSEDMGYVHAVCAEEAAERADDDPPDPVDQPILPYETAAEVPFCL